MFYAPYGKGGKALGGTPAAGAHIDVPHAGAISLGPFTYIPIVHAGPSFAGPAHIDVPHAAYGPFVHGGPEVGETAAFGKPVGYAKGFGKGFGKGFDKRFGKGFGKPTGFGKPVGYGYPVSFGK